MVALSSSELAGMRESIVMLLPDTCQIITNVKTSDGQGGFTYTAGTSSPVACRLDVKTGREQVAGGGIQYYEKTMLSVPYDTTVLADNQVLHNSVLYSVKSLNDDQSWIAVKRIELEKV